MSHLSQAEVDKLWEAQSPIFSQINVLGAEKYMSALPNLKQAFDPKDRSLRCIDEGTPGGLHCAGSGILMDESTAIEEFRRAEVDGIYSHEECGAAGIYAKQKGLDPSKSDEYGIKFAKQLARKLNVPYKGHIGIAEMARPSGLHTARVSYYDSTGRLDPARLKELPNGFVIDRCHHPVGYALQEMKVSIDIALGSHGFSKRFTAETPFILIAIGDEELKKELEPLAAEFDGRVKIDGFTPPSL